MSNASNNAKRALANATQLGYPRCAMPMSLTSDESDCGVGAEFEQFVMAVVSRSPFSASNYANLNLCSTPLIENCFHSI